MRRASSGACPLPIVLESLRGEADHPAARPWDRLRLAGDCRLIDRRLVFGRSLVPMRRRRTTARPIGWSDLGLHSCRGDMPGNAEAMVRARGLCRLFCALSDVVGDDNADE